MRLLHIPPNPQSFRFLLFLKKHLDFFPECPAVICVVLDVDDACFSGQYRLFRPAGCRAAARRPNRFQDKRRVADVFVFKGKPGRVVFLQGAEIMVCFRQPFQECSRLAAVVADW